MAKFEGGVMKRIPIQLEDKKTWAFIEKVGAAYWMHWQGQTFVFEDERKRKSKSQGATDDPTKIVAPMPGKILKLNVAAGDNVVAGQTLVVMEAMKMEYSLKAKVDSKVKSVNAEVSQQVKANDTLVDLEPANSESNNES